MLPTLRDGDQLFVEKVSKYFNGLQFGDVITLSTRDLGLEEEGNNIIKRIVGVPGDCILIEDGRVYRNGEPLDEPYLGENSTTNARVAIYSQVQLGDDEYYVLGDNRQISKDSRTIGPVPRDHIIGEVLFRFYPFNHFGAVR